MRIGLPAGSGEARPGAAGSLRSATGELVRLDPDWDAKRYALACAAIVLLGALALLGMGRTLWGAASGFGLWSGDVDGGLNSQRLADAYTFSHVSHGLVFFLLLSPLREQLATGLRLLVAVFAETAWEVLENTPLVIERFREATIAQGYYGDSILNCLGDVLACIVGFGLAAGLGRRGAFAAFVALELLLAAWIRDGMTLSILMLLVPVPAVQEWQTG